MQRKEEKIMSNSQNSFDSNECKVSDHALESARGGVSAYNMRPLEKVERVEGPVHIGCGSSLIFQQNLGVYYCPKCRKEVPLNEVLK